MIVPRTPTKLVFFDDLPDRASIHNPHFCIPFEHNIWTNWVAVGQRIDSQFLCFICLFLCYSFPTCPSTCYTLSYLLPSSSSSLDSLVSPSIFEVFLLLLFFLLFSIFFQVSPFYKSIIILLQIVSPASTSSSSSSSPYECSSFDYDST